jgi:ABC-2 type transport system permease protein
MQMSANLGLLKINEWEKLRGFSNLFRRENGAWWGTRRWWVNALLWTGLLCGLTAFMLFLPNEEVFAATQAELDQAGGLLAYILSVGLNVFFEFGVPMTAIGTVVLAQDLIIGERHSGVIESLLSKPVTRRAYILAKVAANALPVLYLIIGLPSLVVYGILSLRIGAPFPLVPFLSAVGITSLHTLFYLSLTLMLGTVFTSRGPILGIALGSVLGGGLLGSFLQPLFYITPWFLPKAAWLTSTGQALPTEVVTAALIATALWNIVFVLIALVRFEKIEF